MNIPLKRRLMHIIGKRGWIKRVSVAYLGLWIMCCNINTSILIAYDILASLHEMLGDKGKPTRQVVLKTIMNVRMLDGTSIRDHMIHMITF